MTRIGFGYQEERNKNQENKEKGYYISLENRSLRNFSLFLDAEMTKYNNDTKGYSINPGISYGGISDFMMIAQANIEKSNNLNTDYSLKILGRRKKIMSNDIEFALGTKLLYNKVEDRK